MAFPQHNPLKRKKKSTIPIAKKMNIVLSLEILKAIIDKSNSILSMSCIGSFGQSSDSFLGMCKGI